MKMPHRKRSPELESYLFQIKTSLPDKQTVLEMAHKMKIAKSRFRIEMLKQPVVLRESVDLIERYKRSEVRCDFVFDVSMRQRDRLDTIKTNLPLVLKDIKTAIAANLEDCEINRLAEKVDALGIRTTHIVRWLKLFENNKTGSALLPNQIKYAYSDFASLKRKLASTCMLLVVKIACSYSKDQTTLMELIQDGNVGLMTAAEKFDPSLGWSFSTYATHWIRQGIQNGIRQREFFSLPLDQKTRIERCKYRINELSQQQQQRMSENEKAKVLATSRIDEKFFCAFKDNVLSIEQLNRNHTDLKLEFVKHDEWEQCPSNRIEELEGREFLESALAVLPDRARRILEMRFGLNGEEEHTFVGISDRLGISHQRIQQINRDSLRSLNERLASKLTPTRHNCQ